MKTKEQIDMMIKDLQEIKPRVRHFTFFGDNNQEAIEAQIWVLQSNAIENDVWNRFSEEEEYQRSLALDATDWIDGKNENLLSDWQELIV